MMCTLHWGVGYRLNVHTCNMVIWKDFNIFICFPKVLPFIILQNKQKVIQVFQTSLFSMSYLF
jgi:hypothetical protein